MQIRKTVKIRYWQKRRGLPLVTTAHALLAKVTEEKPAVVDDIINLFCLLTIYHKFILFLTFRLGTFLFLFVLLFCLFVCLLLLLLLLFLYLVFSEYWVAREIVCRELR